MGPQLTATPGSPGAASPMSDCFRSGDTKSVHHFRVPQAAPAGPARGCSSLHHSAPLPRASRIHWSHCASSESLVWWGPRKAPGRPRGIRAPSGAWLPPLPLHTTSAPMSEGGRGCSWPFPGLQHLPWEPKCWAASSCLLAHVQETARLRGGDTQEMPPGNQATGLGPST